MLRKSSQRECSNLRIAQSTSELPLASSFVSEGMRNVAAAKSNMEFTLANPDSQPFLNRRQQRRAFNFKPVA